MVTFQKAVCVVCTVASTIMNTLLRFSSNSCSATAIMHLAIALWFLIICVICDLLPGNLFGLELDPDRVPLSVLGTFKSKSDYHSLIGLYLFSDASWTL